MHYGNVEEFVSLVTEAIPDILTDRQITLLTLGLRARVRDTVGLYINILLFFFIFS